MQPPDGRGSFESPDNASDDASHFYFLLPSAKVGCHPAPFWLVAAAMISLFLFFVFVVFLCAVFLFWVGDRTGCGVFLCLGHPSVQHNDLDGLTDAKRLARK